MPYVHDRQCAIEIKNKLINLHTAKCTTPFGETHYLGTKLRVVHFEQQAN